MDNVKNSIMAQSRLNLKEEVLFNFAAPSSELTRRVKRSTRTKNVYKCEDSLMIINIESCKSLAFPVK